MDFSSFFSIQDLPNKITDLTLFLKNEILINLKRKGAIIGLSGGIDSAVTASLCSKAIGEENVLGLIMPEKESNSQSQNIAENLAQTLNIQYEIFDLTKILDSFHVYSKKESIVKKAFPNFNNNCQYRLVVSNRLLAKDAPGIPYLEVLDENKKKHEIKISSNDYLDLTALTSIKHRVRMTMLYYYGERNRYAVVGTTNKSEFVQGYFVKYGDGGVDIEPLQNLFKTQVYEIANFLKIPKEIIERKASPDVWSFEANDEEFFYNMPYEIVDLMWYAHENNLSNNKIKEITNLSDSQIERISKYQKQKWKASQHMRKTPHSWQLS